MGYAFAVVLLMATTVCADAATLPRNEADQGSSAQRRAGSETPAAKEAHRQQQPKRTFRVCADLAEDPAAGQYATLSAATAALPAIVTMAAATAGQPAPGDVQISLCDARHSTVRRAESYLRRPPLGLLSLLCHYIPTSRTLHACLVATPMHSANQQRRSCVCIRKNNYFLV